MVEICISLIKKTIDIIIDKQQDPKIILATNIFSRYSAKTVNILNKNPNAENIIVYFKTFILLFINNRINVLKYTIMFSAFGFLFNMLTVFALYLEKIFVARIIFGSCCLSMMISIVFFIREIQISTKALKLHISDMDVQFKE